MSAAVLTPISGRSRSGELLEAGGARVFVRRQGRGPAVVGVHAIGHDGRDFDGLAERLGHAFEFITIDWPGHGESPNWDGDASSQRYAEILLDVIQQLGLHGCILLGNSIGGGAAILAAAKMPERVRGLVLCNTAGLVRPNGLTRLVCWSKAAFFGRAERGDASFPAKFRRLYENVVLPLPAAAKRREEIIASALKVGPIIRQAWLSFMEADANLRPIAPTIRVPVLVAWARDDKVNIWRFSKSGAELFPHRQIAMMPGGHTPFLEAPEAFDPVFTRWAQALPE